MTVVLVSKRLLAPKERIYIVNPGSPDQFTNLNHGKRYPRAWLSMSASGVPGIEPNLPS